MMVWTSMTQCSCLEATAYATRRTALPSSTHWTRRGQPERLWQRSATAQQAWSPPPTPPESPLLRGARSRECCQPHVPRAAQERASGGLRIACWHIALGLPRLVFRGFTDSEEEAVGKTAVVPFLLEQRLKELGGVFERVDDWHPHAVRDGQLVTGQNPQSSEKVAELIIEALKA